LAKGGQGIQRQIVLFPPINNGRAHIGKKRLPKAFLGVDLFVTFLMPGELFVIHSGSFARSALSRRCLTASHAPPRRGVRANHIYSNDQQSHHPVQSNL